MKYESGKMKRKQWRIADPSGFSAFDPALPPFHLSSFRFHISLPWAPLI
jgi:hypothetical protein